MRTLVLAHQVRIPVVFTHVRKFYFTTGTSPRERYKKNEQPHVDSTLATRRSVTSFKHYNVTSQRFQDFLEAFFMFFRLQNGVFSGEQEKIIHYSCEGGIENPSLAINDCHHSKSLMMTIGDPPDGFFFPTPTLMMDSYIELRGLPLT